MNWKIKAWVQKTISYLPNGHKVNYLFQKYVTKGVVLSDAYFYDRLEHAQRHIGMYHKLVGSLKGAKTLELGTGWYPVVPLSNFLCGADKICSVDISNLTDKAKLKTTVDYFIQAEAAGKLKNYIPFLPERLAFLKSIVSDFDKLSYEEILAKLNLRFLVRDARHLPELNDVSIDLIHSNNTFEHVYAAILSDILIEFKRLVKKGGMMSHFIDMSDHFAHSDHNITIYNFLKFNQKEWKRIDNSIQPQNRLRFKDFIKMYADVGIPVTDTEFRPGSLEDLAKVKIHTEWAEYSKEELAVSHGYIFSIL